MEPEPAATAAVEWSEHGRIARTIYQDRRKCVFALSTAVIHQAVLMSILHLSWEKDIRKSVL